MNKIKYLMISWLSLGSVYAFGAQGNLALQGIGNALTSDGGASTSFIPIMHAGTPFDIESTVTTLDCQSPLSVHGLATVGNVMDKQGVMSAVFAGSHDIVFTLHHRLGGQDWQAVNHTIACPAGQTLTLKATFYRQNHPNVSTGYAHHLTQTLAKAFTLKDAHGNAHAVQLHATLNFAKPPTTYSCQVLSPTQSIRLNPVSVHELERTHRIQNGNQATISLNCNHAQATVMAMAYDNLDLSNFGAGRTVLSVRHDNDSAKGVGIELYKDGKAVALGQKTTATPLVYDDSYWKIEGGDQRTLTLQAGYVKTGELSSGKVEAQAGLVFFYP